jgi:hypothetical protein
VEGTIDIGQSLIDPRGRLIDFGRALHVESLVRTLVVEDLLNDGPNLESLLPFASLFLKI